MHRPTRTRRILKWTGAGLSFWIVALWFATLWCWLSFTPSKGLSIYVSWGMVITKQSWGVPLDSRRNTSGAHIIDCGIHPWQGLGLEWPAIRDSWNLIGWDGSKPDGRHILVPLWLPLLLTAMPTAWLWHRDRGRVRPGHCPRCGYELTGNTSGVCSECGEKTTPAKGEEIGESGK